MSNNSNGSANKGIIAGIIILVVIAVMFVCWMYTDIKGEPFF